MGEPVTPEQKLVDDLRTRHECTAGFTRSIHLPEWRDLDLQAAAVIAALRRELDELKRANAQYTYPPEHRVSVAEAETERLRRELEAEITRLRKRWADDYAVLDSVSRELTAEKTRFEEHHAAWLENHKYLTGKVRELEAAASKARTALSRAGGGMQGVCDVIDNETALQVVQDCKDAIEAIDAARTLGKGKQHD